MPSNFTHLLCPAPQVEGGVTKNITDQSNEHIFTCSQWGRSLKKIAGSRKFAKEFLGKKFELLGEIRS